MIAALLFILFILSDWLLLSALPSIQVSFAPSLVVPLGASLLVRSVVFFGLSGTLLLGRWRRRGEPPKRRAHASVALFLVVNVGFSLAQLDAYVFEPLSVETTALSLAFDDLDPTLPPVRVVHITDTHIERNGFREMEVVRRVNALQPDIVVFTGDYLNLSNLRDPEAAEHFRSLVAQLEAPYGVYAVRGSVEAVPETMARLLEGTDVVWLEQETVTLDVRGQRVTLVGVACSHRQEPDAARLAQVMSSVPDNDFTLLLYHSPDLIREAAGHGVDLYLAGHTHGGQLRLPFYGAIVTFSRYGRRYASGLFEEADTQLYVSRGLGFEGGGMPRARFLCRPEMVSIELTGKGN
jgi:predicted MPP superfamily phosphohydrolase